MYDLIIVADAYKTNFLGTWAKIADIKKPIVGAVAGYAVGIEVDNANISSVVAVSLP